jgi:putative Mg2+ transporter-C (MgtC) family protein
MLQAVRWLIESWHQLLPFPWAPLLLAPMAALCGALVGTEREHKEKPAGVRTMSMVCLGSALFTMVGYAFSSSTGDSGRVAAQIVTGIGFLGAGIILRGAGGVHGTTTAATVWAVAAMGMIVGAGYAGGGLAAALLILVVLSAIARFERLGRKEEKVVIVFDPDGGKTPIKIHLLMEDCGIANRRPEISDAGNGLERWTLRFRITARHQHEFLFTLAQMPEVRAIER